MAGRYQAPNDLAFSARLAPLCKTLFNHDQAKTRYANAVQLGFGGRESPAIG